MTGVQTCALPIWIPFLYNGRDKTFFFVNYDRTISPSDVGGLVRALTGLVKEGHAWDWTDRIIFLQR